MSWPQPARALLESLEAELRDLLGANLAGLYVYGSLAFGCYNPARSDVDVLVVTRRRMAAETLGPLSRLLNGLPARVPLEISFLSRADLSPWRYPCPFDYHYSLTDEKSDGMDVYFAAEVANARARSIPLVGPPPDELLPAVPQADYLDCLVRDTRWARERADEIPVYAVLNCCRMLAYARNRTILSKAEGGRWGLREVPGDFRPLVETALLAYGSERSGDERLDRREVLRFSEWAEASL